MFENTNMSWDFMGFHWPVVERKAVEISHGFMDVDCMYPLVMTNSLLWKTTMFIGEIHDFYGNVQWQCEITREYSDFMVSWDDNPLNGF